MTKDDLIREFFNARFQENPGAETTYVTTLFSLSKSQQDEEFHAYLTVRDASLALDQSALEDKYAALKQAEFDKIVAERTLISSILNEE